MSARRVLFVLPSLGLGGTERYVLGLAARLREAGREARVVAVRRGGPLLAEARALGVPAVVLGHASLADPRALAALLRECRRFAPEVVHCLLFGFDLLAALAARLSRVPLVLGSRREIGWWMRDRHLLAVRAGNLLVDRIACCSQAVRRDACRRERGAAEAYVVVANGVDCDRYRPEPGRRAQGRSALGLAPADLAVLSVANFQREKGHRVLLEAWSRVREAMPRARLFLVGDGPLRGEIERQAGQLGLRPPALELLGSVADVRDLLNAADLFVLGSLSEGLPNALLEAMSSGLASVATAVGGIPEAIEHGREGLLVPAGDAGALAAALGRLLAEPGLRRDMGERARRAAGERLSAEAGFERYLALIDRGEVGR